MPALATLKGEPLPGSAKCYIHNWESRLRDAVSRLETFTRSILQDKKSAKARLTATQVPLSPTSVPPAYEDLPASSREMVPRDRIELSTPAFSGLCSAN